MADHVTVSVVALEETASRVGGASSAVGDLTAGAADAAALGDAGVAATLSQFVSSWQLQQTQVVASLAHARSVATTAATSYRLLDERLAAAAQQVVR